MYSYNGQYDELLAELEALQAELAKAKKSVALCGNEPLVTVMGAVHARAVTGNCCYEGEINAAIALAEFWLDG